jgi:hypothetical protein
MTATEFRNKKSREIQELLDKLSSLEGAGVHASNARHAAFARRSSGRLQSEPTSMPLITTEHAAEVRVRRHNDVPECDVMVAFRGKEMSIRGRDLTKQSNGQGSNAKPIRLQASGFTVER